MVFIKPGEVLAGSAGYFLKWAGFRLDIGWVSQLMETQLAILCNSTAIELCEDIIRLCQKIVTCLYVMYIAAITRIRLNPAITISCGVSYD